MNGIVHLTEFRKVNLKKKIYSMKIEIKRVTDWQRVVDAARFTQDKEPLGHEPSDEFKKQMILSEHSPLRELEFDIKMYGIPYWVSNQRV